MATLNPALVYEQQSELAARTRRKITARLMPFLILLFVIAFLDRANVSFAGLEMTTDLKFDSRVFGLGSGIFFIGYFILEIPGTLIVETWSARLWLARIIISWGILASLTGFIRNSTHFYVVRFLLGAAEAGFFPGIIVYLSHWFRAKDRAKAVAMFMSALPIASILGAPISGLILRVHWLGLAGWRWVFILQGIPAVIFGIVTIFYLTDRPSQASWLLPDEKDWIIGELEAEKQACKAKRTYTIREAFSQRNVILLAIAYFFSCTAFYGFNFWLPTITKRISGYSNLVVTLVSMLPFIAGLIAMQFTGWSSDRSGERRKHTAIPLLLVSFGLLASAMTQQHTMVALGMFCIAGIGLYSYLPGFWSLPTVFLTETAAAAAVGMINSIGNLGGFAGPFVVGFLDKQFSGFFAGIVYLSASALMAALFVLAVRHKPADTRANLQGPSAT